MKIKEIGEDVQFERVRAGQVLWFCGTFYIKTYPCLNVDNYGMEYNAINIENGDFNYIEEKEWVSFYPNAMVTLV